GDTPQGHFERFVDAWRLAKASSALARPMPVDPFYATGGGPAGGGGANTFPRGRPIARPGERPLQPGRPFPAPGPPPPAPTAPPAARAPAVRTRPAKAAVAAMRDCLGGVAVALSSIPMADQDPAGRVCGLPFAARPEVASSLAAVLDRAGTVIAEIKAIVEQI